MNEFNFHAKFADDEITRPIRVVRVECGYLSAIGHGAFEFTNAINHAFIPIFLIDYLVSIHQRDSRRFHNYIATDGECYSKLIDQGNNLFIATYSSIVIPTKSQAHEAIANHLKLLRI